MTRKRGAGILGRFLPGWMSVLAKIILTVAVIAGCFIVMDYSYICKRISVGDHLAKMQLKYIVLNLMTVGVVWSVLMLMSRRVWLAGMLCAILCGGIAIANYYVIKFHGMPLSFFQIRNLGTAMDVVEGYSLEITRGGWMMLGMTGVMVFACIVTRILLGVQRLRARWIILRDMLLAAGALAIIWFGYFSPKPIKAGKVISWDWYEAYERYGYPVCTMETAQILLYGVNVPDNYNQEQVEEIAIAVSEEEGRTPDVVLILNESLYDLGQIADLNASKDYFEGIRNLDNLLEGKALVPSVGGATNSSEYELLTSNSLYLMPGVTPFNVLELKGANSIVSSLSGLGYDCFAAHAAKPSNYNRKHAYPDLGFDQVRFLDDFEDLERYFNRSTTDKSNYKNLIRWYDEMGEENPRFFYMLTIQNHGSYTKNDPEHDTVFAGSDYGEADDQVDEYLTSVSMSDEAFVELTEYFETVDRDVIICMMGDHCPSFAEELADPSLTAQEKNLLLRSVPLYIWANYPLDAEKDLGSMSMTMVVPTLLDIAGIKLSPYYRYILDMKENVPVMTSYGDYYDTRGNVYNLAEDAGMPYEEMVDNYFFLEYNNLRQEDRRQELFVP